MHEAFAKYLFFFIILVLPFISCTDGCDDQCVNGKCMEDKCLCDPGYEGLSCDISALDFSGSYYGESLTYTECNNPLFNETTFADNQFRFCERSGDERYCREVFLEIREDNAYTIVINDVFITPRTEELKIPDVAEGLYTTEGSSIMMCATLNDVCHTMVRSEDGNQLIWTREGPTCRSTYLMVKL